MISQLYFEIQTESAFATPLTGATLFGQLCWALREREGNDALNQYLKNYATQPFMVISDAMPVDYVPKPLLPLSCWHTPEHALKNGEHKAFKKLKWIPKAWLAHPVDSWMQLYTQAATAPLKIQNHNHSHNSINRFTNSTGADGFAPYSVEETWYLSNAEPVTLAKLCLYIVFDSSQITATQIESILSDVGLCGFGKDAHTGLGKFSITLCKEENNSEVNDASDYFLTLANCAPQGLNYDAEHSYWLPHTHFGKHGNIAARGAPFKNPILLTQTGSIFKIPKKTNLRYIGQAIGGIQPSGVGVGVLSKSIPETVHQGYCPVISIRLSGE